MLKHCLMIVSMPADDKTLCHGRARRHELCLGSEAGS